MNKYLKSDPLSLLLKSGEPTISYLAMRDICGLMPDDCRLADAYRANLSSPSLSALTGDIHNGVAGDIKNRDTYYRGSIWRFAELVNAGLTVREPIVRNTADYLVSTCQMPSGGFSLRCVPPVEDACLTGDMTRYLLLAGYGNDRIEAAIQWILGNQRHDGGWFHPTVHSAAGLIGLMLFRKSSFSLSDENNSNIKSCVYASIACASALVEYGLKNDDVRKAIERATEFFLSYNLFVHRPDSNVSSRMMRYRNSNFDLPGYPILGQYDILSGLIFVSRAGYFSDDRIGEAFNVIIGKQNTDGTVPMESYSLGMLYSRGGQFRNPSMHNLWTTLRFLRLLKAAGLYDAPSLSDIISKGQY
jgi:hypothetical protein